MRVAAVTRIPRRQKQPFPRKTAPQYASHTPYTHTAATKTVFSRKTAPQYASHTPYTHTTEAVTAFSPENRSSVCVSYPVHAYRGSRKGLPLRNSLLSMRLVPRTRIPRNCQLYDLAARRGCSPEGLSWAGSRSPLRAPAGGLEITPFPYHASFPTVCVWQLLLAYRGNENSHFPRKPLHSMRLIAPARIPRKLTRWKKDVERGRNCCSGGLR